MPKLARVVRMGSKVLASDVYTWLKRIRSSFGGKMRNTWGGFYLIIFGQNLQKIPRSNLSSKL
jgi:hypothetical protein